MVWRLFVRLIDLYYRYFKNYIDQIKNNPEGKKNRQAIKRANIKSDSMTIIKYDCQIEDDWIKNIEDGLIYIEKAINEQRQFIRTEGEVVQIEKVKKTSKQSVEHLSRHSNFITRVPKDGDIIIPDKLYIVEKLSDYAVYENRFLLLLLTYLRDFIYVRLEKIKATITTYKSIMNIDKKIDIHTRHIDFQLNFSDTFINDPYLLEKYLSDPLIKRMEAIYYTVEAFLQTPLMKEVAKSPLLTIPIVKTNVLRMNPNFREALKLYDYTMAYNTLGYEFIENKKTYQPFLDEMSGEIAEIIELTTYISYKFGNDISKDLKTIYDQEEEKIHQETLIKKQKELKKLLRRVQDKKMSLEDYLLLLEEQNKALEKENAELVYIKKQNNAYLAKIKVLEEEITKLTEKINESKNQIEDLLKEIVSLKDKYFKDMAEARDLHRIEIDTLNQKHQDEVNHLNEKHQVEMNDLIDKHRHEVDELNHHYQTIIDEQNIHHQTELDNLKSEHETLTNQLINKHTKHVNEMENNHNIEILRLNESFLNEKNELLLQHETIKTHLEEKAQLLLNEKQNLMKDQEELKRQYTNDLVALESKIKLATDEQLRLQKEHQKAITEIENHHDSTVKALNHQIDKLSEENQGLKGQYFAFKQQHGLITDQDDFSSKDRFKELEKMKEAFNIFFKEQWKEAKTKIRNQVKMESEQLLQEETKSMKTK